MIAQTIQTQTSDTFGFNIYLYLFIYLVDGGWSSYTGYGSCSKTCGAGTKSRTRTCSNPTPLHGGQQCSGKSTDTVTCNQAPCTCINGYIYGYKCYMDEVDNGGWRLVRRTGSTSHKWHQAVDGLSGTAVYGSFRGRFLKHV